MCCRECIGSNHPYIHGLPMQISARLSFDFAPAIAVSKCFSLLTIHMAPYLKLAKTLCIGGLTSFACGMVARSPNRKMYLIITLVALITT